MPEPGRAIEPSLRDDALQHEKFVVGQPLPGPFLAL